MNNSVVAILGLGVAFSLPAHATLVTVKASDYAVGTETTHAFEGLTIRSVNGGYDNPGINYDSSYVVPIREGGPLTFNGPKTPERDNVYPWNYKTAQLATRFGSHNQGGDCSHCDGIMIDLDQPTDYVRLIGGTSGDPTPNNNMFAAAFDADWNGVDGCYSLAFPSTCATDGASVLGIVTVEIELSTTTPVIWHILVGGQDIGFLSGLAYNRVVPEPGVLGLLFLGLIGVAISLPAGSGRKAARANT